jgi:hypothetical protein
VVTQKGSEYCRAERGFLIRHEQNPGMREASWLSLPGQNLVKSTNGFCYSHSLTSVLGFFGGSDASDGEPSAGHPTVHGFCLRHFEKYHSRYFPSRTIMLDTLVV